MWRDVLTTVDVKSAVKYGVEPILATYVTWSFRDKLANWRRF
jgi:hypothetical protein